MVHFLMRLKMYLDLDHENFTQQILLGDTEVNEILKRVSEDFPQKVADVIGKNVSQTNK